MTQVSAWREPCPVSKLQSSGRGLAASRRRLAKGHARRAGGNLAGRRVGIQHTGGLCPGLSPPGADLFLGAVVATADPLDDRSTFSSSSLVTHSLSPRQARLFRGLSSAAKSHEQPLASALKPVTRLGGTE